MRGDLNDSSSQRNLLGIPKQPMTPVDSKAQGRLFPPSGANGRVCPSALTKVMQQNEMQAWRQGQAKHAAAAANLKSQSDRLSANSNSAGQQRTEGNKSNNNSPFMTQNSSHTSAGTKQGNERQKASEKTKTSGSGTKGGRGQSKRTQKPSAADAKSSESHSGPPNGAVFTKIKKEFGPRYKSDSSEKETDGPAVKKPDSSNLFETGKPPPKSLFDVDSDEDDHKPTKKEKPRPKLDIPLKTVCIQNLLFFSILGNISIKHP